MANALKCPNPSCPYLFDPSTVPAGVVLACPQCGMRFTIGPQAPAAPPPVPLLPPTPTPGPEHREPAHPSRRGGGWGPILLPAAAILFIAGTLGTGIYFVFSHRNAAPTDDTTSPLRDSNLSYAHPDTPWAPDEEAAKKLGSFIFVYRRGDADAWMAFGAKDYVTRNPRASELAGGLLKPLAKLFENIREEDRPADAKWLGLDANPAVVYRAQRKDGAEVRAAGYAVAYKGMGYWALYWGGPADFDAHRAEFDAVRDRCKLLGLREEWKPKEAEVKSFYSEKADFRLTDADGQWDRPKGSKAADEDEHADLYLVAKEKVGFSTRAAEATLLVYLLDPTGAEPLDVARKYVEAKRTAEVRRGDPKFTPTFTDLTGEVAGEPIRTDVPATAKVARIESKVRGAESQDRLIVLSAMASGGKVVAVHAECQLKHRPLFEPTMVQMAGSLRGK